MSEKCKKNQGKNYFSPLWFLIKKLDHNSGLHAKNQIEISKTKSQKPHPFVWKCVHSPFIIKLEKKDIKKTNYEVSLVRFVKIFDLSDTFFEKLLSLDNSCSAKLLF